MITTHFKDRVYRITLILNVTHEFDQFKQVQEKSERNFKNIAVQFGYFPFILAIYILKQLKTILLDISIQNLK
jgi:hypothetical protein